MILQIQPVVQVKMFLVTVSTVFQTTIGLSTQFQKYLEGGFLTTFQLGSYNHHVYGGYCNNSTLVPLPYTSFSKQDSQSDKIEQSQLWTP